MKKNRTILILMLPVFMLFSCYTTKITPRNAAPDVTIDQELERDTVIHMFLWKHERIWDEDKCPSRSFAEVTIETNFLQSLANVLTIGLWKPIRVKYKCAKD